MCRRHTILQILTGSPALLCGHIKADNIPAVCLCGLETNGYAIGLALSVLVGMEWCAKDGISAL